MWGGPAQQETWDLKPDAPEAVRGEFRPIATNVPGIAISEHFPGLARQAHRLAIVRSVHHADVNHTTATHELLTGRPIPVAGGGLMDDDWPHFGAVLARLDRGPQRTCLLPFIQMRPTVPDGAPRFVEQSHGQGAGWLGPALNPFTIDDDPNRPDYRVGAFRLPDEVGSGRFEDPRLRARYGLYPHGQADLQARRLVKAGVPLVTVFWQNDGLTNVSVYWDTHNRNFLDLKTRLMPPSDQAFTALLDDLDARGLLAETLVVWTGEFGRTPRVWQWLVGGAGAGRDGGDHWPHCFSTVLAGDGIRGGTVFGASDRWAAHPARDPVTPPTLPRRSITSWASTPPWSSPTRSGGRSASAWARRSGGSLDEKGTRRASPL